MPEANLRYSPCFCFYLFVYLAFQDTVSLCSPDCPGIYSVDQVGLKLTDPPASVSQVLGLKACTTTVQSSLILFIMRVLPVCMSVHRIRD